MKRIRAEEQGDGEELRYSGVFARTEHGGADRAGPLSAPPEAEGPCGSFEDVYARYKRGAWAYIRRSGVRESEAMDVCQASFLDMYVWVSEHGLPPDPAPLLFRMIRCNIADHLRGQRRRARRIDGDADADTLPSGEPGADELLRVGDAYAIADIICSYLPPDVGLMFSLSEIDELSVEQIAMILGRREATVRVQIHRARTAFYEMAATMCW
jgi:RNA polymerase sigma factor (sigma-70 family)